MGARESTARHAADEADTGPPDYYALLDVDENASADEIRVSMSPSGHLRLHNRDADFGH